MNGFLVLLSCGFDDLPVGLYETLSEARAAAKALDPDKPTAIESLHSMSKSDPACSKVVKFKNGVPVKVEVVRSYD